MLPPSRGSIHYITKELCRKLSDVYTDTQPLGVFWLDMH